MKVVIADDMDEPGQTKPLRDLAERALSAESLPADTEVSLHLVDTDRIAQLNERHLGKQGPTDVLSFPIEDLIPGLVPKPLLDGPPLHLGDVFISPPVVAENAASFGVSFADEMALMAVHGILHLLGYDHVDDDDAELMEGRERAILAEVGVVRR
jgi:probable rRNA maturation factor